MFSFGLSECNRDIELFLVLPIFGKYVIDKSKTFSLRSCQELFPFAYGGESVVQIRRGNRNNLGIISRTVFPRI